MHVYFKCMRLRASFDPPVHCFLYLQLEGHFQDTYPTEFQDQGRTDDSLVRSFMDRLDSEIGALPGGWAACYPDIWVPNRNGESIAMSVD